MSYYDNSRPWPAVGQNAWNDLEIDSQTVRSGASSTVPGQAPPPPSQGQEGLAFAHQLEEVDRAIDNLLKSGKMFGVPGRHGRQGHMNTRPHSMAEFGDARGAHQSNLQNFYASQRHQSSRGSNDAEQAIQAKRRMAAQRERELRNYHQEQQYNRNIPDAAAPFGNKPDRTLSPSGMSENDRRDLIARQRSALYGEGPFAETGGYVDETGTPRPGVPGPHHGPPATSAHRGPSPLAFEYGRVPPPGVDAGDAKDGGAVKSPPIGVNPQSRTNSTSSPQPNAHQHHQQQQRSSSSGASPVGSSPVNGKPSSGSVGGPVAPIGTRPSISGPPGIPTAASQSSLNISKRATTPLTSPVGHPFNAPGVNNENVPPPSAGGVSSGGAGNGAEGAPGIGVSGWGNRGNSVWGNKGVQASVWG